MLTIFSAAPALGGAGGDALPFLKLDAGARGAAMGGAYCAAGDDALSVFYNPAGPALAERKEALLGHNEWLQEIRNESAAYVHPLGARLTLFGGVNLLLSGSMDKYDSAGVRTGSFSALEGAVSAGAAAALGREFYGGAAVKFLTQRADGLGASAWAGDAGLLKTSGDWRAGVSAANFGSALKLGSRSFPLPLVLRAGVSRSFLGDFLAAAEVVKAGGSDAAAALGAEARLTAGPQEYFYFRGGYKTGRSRYAGTGFTAGIGLTNRDLRVDYAFAPYGELGDAHRVTVALSFGARRPAEARRRPFGGLPPQRAVKKAAPARQGGTKAPPKKKRSEQKDEVYFMW
ncbi:MAG: PorV/PorQ family protein [Elusimicrobiales bacterium]